MTAALESNVSDNVDAYEENFSLKLETKIFKTHTLKLLYFPRFLLYCIFENSHSLKNIIRWPDSKYPSMDDFLIISGSYNA